MIGRAYLHTNLPMLHVEICVQISIALFAHQLAVSFRVCVGAVGLGFRLRLRVWVRLETMCGIGFRDRLGFYILGAQLLIFGNWCTNKHYGII